LNEGGARSDNGFWIVMTKGGDRAVVERQLAQQPQRFEVANAGSF
jgi:hypothetical protein